MTYRRRFGRGPILCLVLALGLLPRTCEAYKRLVEEKGFIKRPVFGVLAGAGSYAPASGGSGSTLLATAGLRYLKPDPDDATYHSLGVDLTLNSCSTSTEDIMIVDIGVMRFYPCTAAFAFDHHFFWGGGFGQASITRPRMANLTMPVGYLTAGVQGRVRDWYLEARLKTYLGQQRTTYNLSGFVPQIVGVYHFSP